MAYGRLGRCAWLLAVARRSTFATAAIEADAVPVLPGRDGDGWSGTAVLLVLAHLELLVLKPLVLLALLLVLVVPDLVLLMLVLLVLELALLVLELPALELVLLALDHVRSTGHQTTPFGPAGDDLDGVPDSSRGRGLACSVLRPIDRGRASSWDADLAELIGQLLD